MTLRVVTFKIPHKLLEKVDLIAVNRKVTRSDIIREAIMFYLQYKDVVNKHTITREV